jgi:DNA-binding PadR family transcriptional regulator
MRGGMVPDDELVGFLRLRSPLSISLSGRPVREHVMTQRSDLEHVVLGIVWKMGPLTPYAIRQEFLTSPTPHFSGSAGAIYPLVRRLERDGLLASETATQGRRRSRKYSITRAGTTTLKTWLGPGLPESDGAATYDPIRTRLYFLSALPKAKRLAVLDRALESIECQLPELESDEQRYLDSGDVFSRLASQGIRKSLEGRLKWLKGVRRQLRANGLA